MLECNLLKDEGRVIVKENDEEVFECKFIGDSNIAILDDIEFSDKKIEELSSGNILQSSVAFLRRVEDVVIKTVDEMNLNVDLVAFGNFASVKKLDTIAKAFDIDNSKGVTQSNKR